MLRRLFQTNNKSAVCAARVALGIVILPHGLQKLFGLFGGFGFSATINNFTGTGMPAAIAFLIIMAESFGALSLILGFLSKFAAFGINVNPLKENLHAPDHHTSPTRARRRCCHPHPPEPRRWYRR
ncbi:MAG: DoxX family protein [bacterium]